jgi:hypothetical protein
MEDNNLTSVIINYLLKYVESISSMNNFLDFQWPIDGLEIIAI